MNWRLVPVLLTVACGPSPSTHSGPTTRRDPCTLRPSGPIVIARDGESLTRVKVTSTDGAAILIQGRRDVTLRDVHVVHRNGPGIVIADSARVHLENVSVEYEDPPPRGKIFDADHVNVSCYLSASVTSHALRLAHGSAGIYLLECDHSSLRFVEGYDFRGPQPRGQLVQWDKSDGGLLEDFSVTNSAQSSPEDNVNVFQSKEVTIRRGLIDGNNSPSGVGVIFDSIGSYGVVEDVDAVRMSNGCFSTFDGADGSVFRRTRCRDNRCDDQGRGRPLSGALMWAGHGNSNTCCKIEDSSYFNACNEGNIVWPVGAFSEVDLVRDDFEPRAPIRNRFCWE